MNWVVAFTRPRNELQAERSVNEAGFETFLPLERISTVRGGKRLHDSRPFFPRYLFVRHRPNINSLFRVRNVAGVVTYEYDKDEGYRAPAIMSDGIVQLLRQQCSDDGTIQRQVKFTGLVNGQRVTPTKGALVGRVGRFEYSAKRREFALFSLFGREVSVPFKRGDLLAA